MKLNSKQAAVAAALASLAGATPAAWGDAETDKLRAEIEQLKRDMRELRSALERQKQDTATKQDVQAVQSEVAQVRSSAESSSMLGRNSMAHLAGYGDFGYARRRSSDRGFNLASFNPIFHFQYQDRIFFETELETVLQPDGTTEVNLEYANLNYFLNDYVTLFGGKFLSPSGYFRQNLHPSWINKFASEPPGFGHDGAAPSSDVGAGARGGFYLGSLKAEYALYADNRPRLELNRASHKVQAIMADDAPSNPAKTLLLGGRVALQPVSNLEFGVSAGTSRGAGGMGGVGGP